MSRAPLRSLCVQALRDWENGSLFAETIIDRLAVRHQLDERDRGFLNEVVLGVLRNLLLIDHRIGHLRERGKLRPETRNILRAGLYQLFHMRVPDHAAVGETVALAKTKSERGLVNAILRRAVRERDELANEETSLPLSTRCSMPEFLIERWTRRFGENATRDLCEWINRPAPVYVRVNTLVPEALDTIASSDALPFDSDSRFYRVEKIPTDWIARGLCYVQDPSTAAACDLLDPAPGDTVLDACAAPGGKTCFLAGKMANGGRIIACDADERRLDRLGENLARLGVMNTETACIDWTAPLEGHAPACPPSNTHNAIPPLEGHAPACPQTAYDAILVDAPCSNTGVMRRRVDVRWRLDEKIFARMAGRQLEILRHCVPLLRRGGKLVYSTCSIEPEENAEVIDRLLAEFPELRLDETRELLPFTHDTDGAFAARLIRS